MTSRRIRVGGRVIRGGGGELLVSDALESIAVSFTDEPTALETGDLVVIEAELSDGALVDATLHETHIPRRRSSREVARLRDAGIGHALVLRAHALAAVRDYFAREGFLEVETPCLVPSPGLDRHLDAYEAASTSPARFLITSPEYQMKRLITGGVPRSFQIARCFRRGEIGSHHNPEFTMLEWYRGFAGMDAIVRDTEEIVVAVTTALRGAPRLSIGDREIALERPFPRITVQEAFRDLGGVGEDEMLSLAEHDEESFFRVLIDRIEPALARRNTPVVLHRYPAKMGSLARLCPDDARYAERFEVYVAGMELSNGFGELTDPVEQRTRLERDQTERGAAGQPVYPIDERFLDALEEGFPPSAGNALGLDRLVAVACGKARIADVLAFPEGIL